MTKVSEPSVNVTKLKSLYSYGEQIMFNLSSSQRRISLHGMPSVESPKVRLDDSERETRIDLFCDDDIGFGFRYARSLNVGHHPTDASEVHALIAYPLSQLVRENTLEAFYDQRDQLGLGISNPLVMKGRFSELSWPLARDLIRAGDSMISLYNAAHISD